MSEMLYLFGEMDSRFRTLVTTVRYWAATTGLTNPNPGPYITNFALNLLVVFYLQTCTLPILPTLNEMMSLARPKIDRRWIEDDIECTFLRDPSPFRERAQLNQSSFEDLFIGFLHFIESFNFSEKGLSVFWGKPLRKSDSSPMHVENPLERELNVCKNVGMREATRLVMEARNTLYHLETREKGTWGLLVLSSTVDSSKINSRKASIVIHESRPAGLSMQELFKLDEEQENSDPEQSEQMTRKVAPSSTPVSSGSIFTSRPVVSELNTGTVIKNLFLEKGDNVTKPVKQNEPASKKESLDHQTPLNGFIKQVQRTATTKNNQGKFQKYKSK